MSFKSRNSIRVSPDPISVSPIKSPEEPSPFAWSLCIELGFIFVLMAWRNGAASVFFRLRVLFSDINLPSFLDRISKNRASVLLKRMGGQVIEIVLHIEDERRGISTRPRYRFIRHFYRLAIWLLLVYIFIRLSRYLKKKFAVFWIFAVSSLRNAEASKLWLLKWYFLTE